MRQDLLDTYVAQLSDKAKRPYGELAERFLKWLGNKPPDAQAVRQWLALLEKKRYSQGTRFKYFNVLRRLFVTNKLDWPFRRGDAPQVTEYGVYAPALHPNDISRMIRIVRGLTPSECDIKPGPAHKAFLCLSTIYGLRRVEMFEVQEGMLDFKKKLLYISTAKHGRQRWHIIPDHIMPYLQEWGFKQRLSTSGLTILFVELRQMIGLEGKKAYQLGWHSIRRTLTRRFFELGLPANEIQAFLRWKRGGTDMTMRYGTTVYVGTQTSEVNLADADRATDEHAFALHPFLEDWK